MGNFNLQHNAATHASPVGTAVPHPKLVSSAPPPPAAQEDFDVLLRDAEVEDSVARALMTWGVVGAFAGCAGGAVWAGFGGAFFGGTALSALAIALTSIVLGLRARFT